MKKKNYNKSRNKCKHTHDVRLYCNIWTRLNMFNIMTVTH